MNKDSQTQFQILYHKEVSNNILNLELEFLTIPWLAYLCIIRVILLILCHPYSSLISTISHTIS